MTKSELIQRLAEKNRYLYQRDIEIVINTIFDEIANTLAEGGRCELRRLGTFTVKERPEKMSRNPGTGEKSKTERKFVPAFRVSRTLYRRMNSN